MFKWWLLLAYYQSDTNFLVIVFESIIVFPIVLYGFFKINVLLRELQGLVLCISPLSFQSNGQFGDYPNLFSFFFSELFVDHFCFCKFFVDQFWGETTNSFLSMF